MTLEPLQAAVSAEPRRSLTYTVGPWCFCPEDGVLGQPGMERRLEDRAARTLALLCQRRGEVVSQQKILEAVWNGRAVSGNSVSIVVGDLRRALDDDRLNPTYIETLTKRGYRLRPETLSATATPAAAEKTHASRRFLITGGVAAGLGALSIMLGRAEQLTQVHVLSQSVQNDTGRSELDRLARALGMLVDLQLANLPRVTVVRGDKARSGSLLFRSKLILWNDQPTLSLEAIRPETGMVRWAGMADGPASALAGNTIAQIKKFAAIAT